MAAQLSMEEYAQYREGYVGYCTTCKSWTGECVEPDGREYECETCGQATIYGAEEAMLLGLVEVV